MDAIMSTVRFNTTARNDTIIKAVGDNLEAYGSRPWGYLALLVAAYWAYTVFHIKPSKYPTINYDEKAWTYWKAKMTYLKSARELLAKGSEKFAGPFNLITFTERLLILPPEYIDSINAEPTLNFNQYIKEEMLSDFETFRSMRPPPPGMFEEMVMKGLTRALPKFTKPLSLEMTGCLNDTWGNAADWREVPVMKDALIWVARLSNRIFLGPSYAAHADWLRITTSFTVDLFTAIGITKAVPGPLRWLVDLVSPLNRKVRRDYRKATAILAPEFKARTQELANAKREGRNPELPDDAIEWFRSAAHGRTYDEANLQVALAVAAIHTTSDLVTQAMLNLCAHPEVVQPLRQEIIDVLGKFGLQKVALTELRLLDSFFKETQRLKPIGMSSMHRSALKDVKLPGGIHIKKGEHIAVSSHRMWDAKEYPEPDTFDAYRYVERRKLPGYENKSLLVSTSPDHMGFSHGKHACPGRFFAANEVKIAMIHLLLKYDLKIKDPSYAEWKCFGVNMVTNPEAKIMYRSRVPEFDLDQLAMAL